MKKAFLRFTILLIILLGIALLINRVLGASILFPYQGGTGANIAPTNGQLLIGNGSSTYSVNTLTASGTNIQIVNGSGTINLGVSSNPTFGSLTFTNASGSNMTLTGFLSVSGNLTDANNNKFSTSTIGLSTVDGQLLFGVLGSGATSTMGLTYTTSTNLFTVTASSSFKDLVFTSASGTAISVTGYGLFPTLNFTNASGTNGNFSGFLGVVGQSVLGNTSSTNLSVSGFLQGGTVNVTTVSSTNLFASGYISAANVSSSGNITGVNLQATTGANLGSVSSTNLFASGYTNLQNVSGTTATFSTSLQGGTANFTTVSSTNLFASGYINALNVSTTNLSASGFLQGGTANFTTVSSTNLYASGYLNVGLASTTGLSVVGNEQVTVHSQLATVSSTNIDASRITFTSASSSGAVTFGTTLQANGGQTTLSVVSSTNVFASGYIQGGTVNVTTVSSTNLYANGYLFVNGSTTINDTLVIPASTTNRTLGAAGQLMINVTTGTLNYYAGAQAAISPTSTVSWTVSSETGTQDDNFWIAPYSGTLTNLVAFNKTSGTVPFDIGWGNSGATATGTVKKAVILYYAASSTGAGEKVAINGSSTFVNGDVFRYFTSGASSTEFSFTLSYTPLP